MHTHEQFAANQQNLINYLSYSKILKINGVNMKRQVIFSAQFINGSNMSFLDRSRVGINNWLESVQSSAI